MNFLFIQALIIFVDYIRSSYSNDFQRTFDKTLNIVRTKNISIITLGYVAGLEFRPGIERREYIRSGRHISGALTYAIYKINTMAERNDKESLLPSNYRLNLHFIETYGEEEMSIQAVANMSVRNNVWAIIGPQETCRTEAAIVTAYNLLMISHYCTDNFLIESPKKYPTFIVTRPQITGLAESLVSFLKKFQWNEVTLVVANNKEFQIILQICKSTLEQNKIVILHLKTFTSPAIFGASNDMFKNVIENTYRTSRIYVFIGHVYEVLGLLMGLYQRNLTDTGEYFVISVALRLESLKEVFMRGNQEILRSMRNFVIISHIKPEERIVDSKKRKFKQFMNLPPFNVKSEYDKYQYFPIESSYLYDAVWLYATALGKIIRNRTLGSPRNGTLLKNLLLNLTYKSVFGYMNRIDSRGVASGNYTLNQVEVSQNGNWKFESIGLFTYIQDKLQLKFLTNKNINWINNIPRDVPKCGFKGEKCQYKEKIILISLSIGILMSAAIFILAFVIKSNKYEKELERLLWKIDKNKEIDLTNPELLEKFSYITRPSISEAENKTVYLPYEENSKKFLITLSCCNIPILDWQNSNILLGMYKNQEVIIKKIYFSSTLSITRAVKKELKILREISFMNLNKFMGIIIEHQDTWVVWEFCDRGSLQDVLYSTSLTKNYPVFLSSFAFDVIRGLIFLHENPDINFHGHLKSSNCLVDSRWTVKLTDYGMTEFLTNMLPSPDMPEYLYFLSLFWTAPEILRKLIKHKFPNNLFTNEMLYEITTDKRSPNFNKNDDNFSVYSNNENCLELFIKNTNRPTPNNLDFFNYQKGDIYSFGMIFYELHSCQIPFLSNYSSQNSPKEIIRRLMVLNDEFKVPYRPKLSLLSRTNKKQIEVIKLCWQENFSQRPTAKNVYNRLKMIFGDKRNLVECMKEKMILYTKNLEKEVMKRTEELREEKKQNEELLYQMLPIPVAEQLRQHKQVEAEAFDCVSIYFSDIVGFTELSCTCTPFEVVNLLNKLYTSFDNIIDNFNVYKVETIGDSYMVVSGLPTVFDEHAREMANMSLRLLEEITKGFIIPSKLHENETLKLRIGLHCGPCCAGVVGTRNPRYCLFGDTVNMASRMESTGEALKIHCSEAFVHQIKDLNEFTITERGVTEVKGKGFLTTYWLIGKSEDSNLNSASFVNRIYLSCDQKFGENVLEPKNAETPLKVKIKNNFFEKMKENTHRNKFNHKKDLIK